MQPCVVSLTAALLFIHTVCGCCWHHAQQCEHGWAVGHTSCDHHDHDSRSSQPDRPCNCKLVCEGTCNYILTDEVKIEAPQWVSIDLLAILPSVASRHLEAPLSWEAASSLTDWAPPVRTHLLHQVLLS